MLAVAQIVQVQESMLAPLLHPDPRKPTYQRLGQDVVGVYARTGDVYGAALGMRQEPSSPPQCYGRGSCSRW